MRNEEKKKQSRTENVKRILLGGFLQQLVNQILPFVTRTLIIYTIGELYAGLNGLFASILQVLNLAELGFSEAMIFSMYKPLADKNREKICALLNLYRRVYRVVGITIGVVGVMLLPFLRFLIKGEVPQGVSLPIIYLLTLANTCVGYLAFAHKRALFTADQKSDVLSLIGCLTSVLEFLARLAVLVLLRNYYLYCAISPVIHLASGLYIHHQSKKRYPDYICTGRVNAQDIHEIKQKLLGLFVNRFCYVCRNSFDSMTVSAFMGLVVVAVFQNYYLILRAVTGFSVLISGSIVASAGNSIATESQEKNYGDFQKLQLLFMWIAGWCTVCLFCLYQPFMRLWMGEARMLTTAEMLVFCVYYFTDMMGSMCYAYRQAAGLYQYRRFVPVLESAVNIALNILLVSRFGVTGVLMSTIFCQVFINTTWSSGILYDFYFTAFQRSRYLLRLCGYGAVTAAACAATWLVCTPVALTGIPELFVRGCICVVVPNVIFALSFRVFPEYRDAISFITTKLMKKRRSR